MEDYKAIGKHKGCKYQGTIYHITDPDRDLDYKWCRGDYWDSLQRITKRCGASTLKGDVLEVEPEKAAIIVEAEQENEMTINELYAYAEKFVGIVLEDAKEFASVSDLEIRVAKRDGQDLELTCDFKFNRVNVAVENGVIVKVVSLG